MGMTAPSWMHRCAWGCALLAVVACQKKADTLPEPVAASRPAPSFNTTLPPNHPPVSQMTAPPGQTAPRALPPGTRNPMEDIMAFKARLEKDPKDFEALVSLANANMMISRFDAAQDLYARALAIQPKNLDLRTNLAIAYKYGGHADQALAELERNLTIDPKHDSTLFNLGFLYYFDLKDSAKALATWKKWLALYPSAPDAAEVTNRVAQIEAETGRAAGAPPHAVQKPASPSRPPSY